MSHRATLMDALRLHGYKSEPVDKEKIPRFLSLLEEEHAFQRNHFIPGHITASAWLVDETKQRVLLTHHAKLDKWLQLGGHTDGNEDTVASALREAYEESGLEKIEVVSTEIFDVDIHLIPARKTEPAHEHFDIRYAFICRGDPTYRVSDESHDLRWVPIKDIRTITQEESMLRMADRWLSIEEQNK